LLTASAYPQALTDRVARLAPILHRWRGIHLQTATSRGSENTGCRASPSRPENNVSRTPYRGPKIMSPALRIEGGGRVKSFFPISSHPMVADQKLIADIQKCEIQGDITVR
jgi:hypothetical protein